MRTQALLMDVWHQQSKDPKQVWRCRIANPAGGSVMGTSDTECDAIKDAFNQLATNQGVDVILPASHELNVSPMIRQAPRVALEAVQYEYGPGI